MVLAAVESGLKLGHSHVHLGDAVEIGGVGAVLVMKRIVSGRQRFGRVRSPDAGALGQAQ